jgi:tRNA pseudouridine32 synthase / 23S rRNA pseudouridine746 synthase
VEHADAFFHEFDAQDLELPRRLNNPFFVEISELGKTAFEHFKQKLMTHPTILNHFECGGVGKMFGLLVVKNFHDQLGYLAAFSGKINDTVSVDGFVPPVFDTLVYDGFYKRGERVLDGLTHEIEVLLKSQDYLMKQENFVQLKLNHQAELKIKSEQIKAAKAERKLQRIRATPEVLERLSQESIEEQLWLKWRKKQMQLELDELQKELDLFEKQIQALKDKRKALSQYLQQQLFEHYTFLNAKQEKKNLLEIFQSFGADVPPAGAGECAAPKLFQYAFQKGYEPIELIEFWWGPSSSSQIRVQGNFYPSCRSKCEPILNHMLSATESEAPPVLNDDNRLHEIQVIYQDEFLAVLNKPYDVLSVPGKVNSLSVADYLPTLFPNAERPMLVHRLDRATSGILLVAMNQKIYVALQQQFTKRTVKKKYIAVLDGMLEEDSGLIDLPLRVDLDNRPQQMVCYEHGLPASTRFEVLSKTDGKTRIAFYPITGRTHQLRVHAAHPKGLNTPIVGDDLYGTKAERLHLHAAELCFVHPTHGKLMEIECDIRF